MSRATVEAGLEALLAAVSGFSAAQVSTEDYTVLNRGVSKAIVIERGGTTESTVAFSGGFNVRYRFGLALFERYQDPATTADALATDGELVKQRLRQYTKLNGVSGVLDSVVTGERVDVDPPPELVGDPNLWRSSIIDIEVWELNATQHAE